MLLLNLRKHDILKIVVIETEANDDKTSTINKNSEKMKEIRTDASHAFTNVHIKKDKRTKKTYRILIKYSTEC